MSKQNDEEDFKEKLKEDLRWLQLACPKSPGAADIEAATQCLAILKSINPFIKNFTKKDLIKLSFVGYIASQARKVDEKRFQEISPFAYFQLAHYWTEPDNDQEYGEFIKRIIG